MTRQMSKQPIFDSKGNELKSGDKVMLNEEQTKILKEKDMKIEDVKYKKHKFEIVEWFKNDETKLGEIENEHDFNNLRIELVKNNLTQDCYFMWNDKKITLDEEGNMSSFPRGLYDHVQMAMSELFKLRKQ
jgi:hypothetical protein